MNGMQNATFGDKERMTDFLYDEKQLAAQYCTFLSEAATPEVVRTLTVLLSDTHTAQHALFEDMNNRGWYPVAKAEDTKVAEQTQKFGTMVTK